MILRTINTIDIPSFPLGSLSGGLPIVAGLCATDAAGGGYEDMQRGIPLINNLKIELISSDKDDDANSEVIGVSQSDILTNSKTPSEHDTPHILRAGEAYEHDLYLENAVFRDDVADEDEIAEVLSDLRSLCEVFGHISAVWIEKINKIPLQTVETGLLSYADFTFGEPAVSPSLWVFIEYDTVQEAAVAVAALNGLCIGGKAISARMYSYSAYSAGKCSDTHCWDIDYLSLLGVNSDGMIGVHSTVEGAVVALLDYVTVDDYEGCSGDSEELGTIKRDLIDLVTAQSSSGHREISESAFIRRVTIMAPTGGDDETHPAGDEPALGSERLAACVRYSSIGDSTAAMLSLDGTILGGSRLKAWVKRSSNAPQSVSPQDSAFDAVEGEVLEGSGNVFANQLIALRTFETTRPTLEGQSGTPIAGSSLDPQAPLTPPISAGSNTRKIASNSGESVDEEAVFSVQPAYKEARLAPKLEKNSILDSRHRIKVLISGCWCGISTIAQSL